MDRELAWDGCSNVRDLGGLPTRDGGTTAWGAVIRSDHPNRLSEAGWLTLQAHGVRTIVTLTTEGVERESQLVATCPGEVSSIEVAIEDAADPGFASRWVESGLWGTPMYWQDALSRWPTRHAAAMTAIANARPGGVLIHCGRGHDRTGIVACLLLGLVGVQPEEIARDYETSKANMPTEQQRALRDTLLRERSSSRKAIIKLLAGFDIESCLRGGGMTDGELIALRARLLD